MKLVYGVCVGSWDKLRANVVPHVGSQPLLGLSGQSSIADAYNTILDAYQDDSFDALVLQHDDLEITDPEADNKFLEALSDPAVALVGIAGGSARTGMAWWNVDPIGHQKTDAMMIDFGVRTGDVDLLEGSLLVFSPWAVRNLRFDSRPGFHSYDEIAMRVHRTYNKRVVVVDVDTHHHTGLGFDDEASQAGWLSGDIWFREKWDIR